MVHYVTFLEACKGVFVSFLTLSECVPLNEMELHINI